MRVAPFFQGQYSPRPESIYSAKDVDPKATDPVDDLAYMLERADSFAKDHETKAQEQLENNDSDAHDKSMRHAQQWKEKVDQLANAWRGSLARVANRKRVKKEEK